MSNESAPLVDLSDDWSADTGPETAGREDNFGQHSAPHSRPNGVSWQRPSKAHTRRDNGGPVFARFIVMPGHYRRPRRYLECYRFSYIRALWVAIVSTTVVDTRTPERH